MERHIHQTYYFKNGDVRIPGFIEDGVLYLRMRQLLTAVAREGDEGDRASRDALAAGIAAYARHAGGAYGVLCRDGTDPAGTKRLYISKRVLDGYLEALAPDSPESDLLLRAMAAFDGMDQDGWDSNWEPREVEYVAAGDPPGCGFRFGTGTYPEQGRGPGFDPDDLDGLEPDPDITADFRPLAAIAAAGTGIAVAAAILRRRRKR